MITGYTFDGVVNAISILDDWIVVGGNFNYIYFQGFKYPFDKEKYGEVLTLENDKYDSLYVGFQKGIIMMFILRKEFKFVKEIRSNQTSVECLHYYFGGGLLFSGSIKDRAIQVWDKNLNYIFTMDEEEPTKPNIFTSAKNLYSGNYGGSITVWDVEKFKYKNFIQGDGDKIIGLEIYKENLISCTNFGLIKIRDISKLYTKLRIETGFNLSSMIVFNNDILTGTRAGIIKYYDMEGRHHKDKVTHEARISVMKKYYNKLYTGSFDMSYKSISF